MTLSLEPRLGPPDGGALAAEKREALQPTLRRERPAPTLRAERAAPLPRVRPRRRRTSPLLRRILTLNVLALIIPIVGLLYLDQYRDSLITAELEALKTEGQLFAVALGETGVTAGDLGDEKLMPETARLTLRRMVEISKNRARLFALDGSLVADSLRLLAPEGPIVIVPLEPPKPQSLFEALLNDIYDWVVELLPNSRRWPLYHESTADTADIYPEVGRALAGEVGRAVYERSNGNVVLHVAVPVQRYRQIMGALLMSSEGGVAFDARIEGRSPLRTMSAASETGAPNSSTLANSPVRRSSECNLGSPM